MGNQLSLKIFKGSEEVGTETFDREIIKIGRLASAHLKLDDPKVSRIHAVIEVSRGGQDVSIIDMGSAEGTFVNGEKVTKVKLKNGDEIRLGDTRLVLGLPGDGAPAAAGDTTGLMHAKSNGELEALASLKPPPDDGDVFSGETVDLHGVTPAQPTVLPPGVAVQPAVAPAAAQPSMHQPMVAAAAVASVPPMAASMSQAAMINQAMYDTGDEDSGMSLGYGGGGGGVSAVQYAPSEPIAYGEAPIIWYSEYNEIPDIKIEPEGAVTQTNRAIELAVLWGDQVLTVKHFKAPKKPVTMGEHEKADVFVTAEGLPDPVFPLVRYMDGEYVLTYCDNMTGSVATPEKLTPLKELKGSPDGQYNRSFNYPLPINSVTNIEYAGLTLQLQFVPPPAIVAASPFSNLNYNWLNVFLISAFAHIGIFTTAALYPYDTKSLEEDLLSSPNRFAQFLLNAPEKKKNNSLDKLIGKEGEASAKHTGGEGKAGKKDAKDTGKRMATKTDKPTNEMVVANKLAQLFGKDGAGGGVGTIFGGALGGELVGAIGGVTGEQIGDSFGFGGLGMRGHGPGGGGTSTSTFGVGSIGTRGRGGGSAGYGSGAGGLGGKADHGIRISQGTPVIMGSLDKEIIRRVIKENLSQIRYCYERELAKSPGLYGKVQVKFIIAATGLVSNSQIDESTMKNANVEQCIAQKVRGWRFPKPKGGGIVIVTYPFIFKQSG